MIRHRAAFKAGVFEGLNIYNKREVKDGMLEISENEYYHYPMELESYERGFQLGRNLQKIAEVAELLK